MVIPISTPTLPLKNPIAERLELACKDVEAQLLNDKKYPTIEEQLKIGVTGQPAFSGVHDFDYPSLTDGGLSSLERQLASVKRVPLPEELREQFASMQCNCMMGIFPEISRGWLSIDSALYFWVYEDGSDIAYYDGLQEIIIATGLIKPKPAIFPEHIQYLLCVTTPTNIHVLGVTFSEKGEAEGDTFGTIHLHPEPLLTVASDNVYLTSVVGTSTGRIFLGGRDGAIYELVYQVKNSWFSNAKVNQCYKINHTSSKLSYLMPAFIAHAFSVDDSVSQLAIDHTRGIMYCRTSKGNIQIYDLGADFSTMKLVAGISESNIASHAHYAARTIDARNFEKVIHIAPLSRNDSALVHLVAITETGARLYFTTCTSVNERPSHIRLVHVRMPPGYAPSSAPDKPQAVHSAFHRQGTTILTATLAEDVDALWCFSQDTYPFKTPIKETQASVRLDGRTWCLAEVSDPSAAGVSSAPCHLFANESPEPPSIATQHVLPPRRFVLLSAQGSHVVTTLRPLEQLRALLCSGGTGESESVASFFKLYGEDQACATCLTLICNSADAEPEVVEWATQAFFRFGGEAAPQVTAANRTTSSAMGLSETMSYIAGSPVQGGSSQGSFLATPRNNGLQATIPTPMPPSLDATTVSPPGITNINKRSGKHHGILLYFARIVKPIWTHPLVSEVCHNQLKQLWSRLTSSELTWFICQLERLRQFIDQYLDIDELRSPSYIYRQTLVAAAQNGLQDTSDRDSLVAFRQLLALSIEALQLWRVLADHQMHVVVSEAPDDVKEKLKFTAMKDFFSPAGRELSGSLINLLMSKYLYDNAAIDTVNLQLREICPTIYSAEDALYTKANEVLLSASLVKSSTEKEKILQEAINVYSQVPHLVDLKWVCQQMQENTYYRGIVDLCLTIALKRDEQGVALYFYKSGEQRGDVSGTEAFAVREEAYMCVINSLEFLLQTSSVQPLAPSPPTRPGPPPTTAEENTLTPELATQLFEDMMASCLKSADELFHISLYDWLIGKRLTDRLLEIRSPFLEQYLVTTANDQHPANRETLDLLWKFYEKRKNYIAAAKILLQLAEREGLNLTIHDRLEYLSRAMISTKSVSISTSASNEGEFMHEIEEKLDVARIQLKVFEQLLQSTNRSSVPSSARETALAKLNTKLFDISVLYGDYAEEFSLPESKLAIIHCASHSDTNLVEKIWMEIIEKEFDTSKHLTSESRMQTISQQLASVGKIYIHHERYFPTEFLIFSLERKSCSMLFEPTWTFQLMEEIGVSFATLFREYNKLSKDRDGGWARLGRPLHIVIVNSLLLLKFLDQPSMCTQQERMMLTRAMYEAVIAHLVDLEAMDSSVAMVQQLLTRYKGIQAKLKRLL